MDENQYGTLTQKFINNQIDDGSERNSFEIDIDRIDDSDIQQLLNELFGMELNFKDSGIEESKSC